ncbi:hypothetical protein C8J56DRAFT_1104765 [Mycena floridula]|nr:hypothetical protein C8J56DRAFT_1104765 [Mycena floridula]
MKQSAQLMHAGPYFFLVARTSGLVNRASLIALTASIIIHHRINAFTILGLKFPASKKMTSTNFDVCLSQIQGNETLWRTGGTDMLGHPITDVSDLVGITYRMCISQCGSAPEAFSFPAFSTQFSSFMLPFLALTAQLPFGATNSADNFSTIALTVGCPTLAIFSLMITVLNSRWLKRRFARISYPNTNHAQSLLRVEQDSDGCPLLASLIVLPQNDQWWQRGASTLLFTHTWSMVNIATVIWAIIAYLLTVTSMDPRSYKVIGPAVACAWLWLLPLVVGWFQTSPNCDEAMLKMKVAALNETVFIAVGDKGSTDPPVLVRDGAGCFAIEVISADFDVSDESRSPPFYNYSRVFSWAGAAEKVASGFEAASFRASRREPVTGSEWKNTDQHGSDVHPDNRVGNSVDVQEYIDVDRQQASRWGPEVWTRFRYTAVTACLFQWLSAGSAVFAAWMSPAVGLGCHSASFILYGALSTLAFFMILLGEVLQQFYHPTTSHLRLQETIGFFAAVFRRIGKILAWFNALIFISVDILAFANILDNCYCTSTVMGVGLDHAYSIFVYSPSMHILNWWVAAVIVSTISAIVFWFSIFTLGR